MAFKEGYKAAEQNPFKWKNGGQIIGRFL
jgi:hypothetical protein